MASPVKALVDYNGTPFWMSKPQFAPGLNVPVIDTLGLRMAVATVVIPHEALVAVFAMRKAESNAVFSKIPPPPMGRQVLATFPPVYKERTSNAVPRPSAGQVWPRLSNMK